MDACNGFMVSCSWSDEFKQELNVALDSGVNIFSHSQVILAHVLLTRYDHGGKESALIRYFAAFCRAFCTSRGVHAVVTVIVVDLRPQL